MFTVQPVGWVGEWHENPAPQWIVPCCPAAGGSRAWTAPASSRAPGEFSFGEDQGCTRTQGPQGPPLRHDRRRAGRADDGAAARAARAAALPHRRDAALADGAGRAFPRRSVLPNARVADLGRGLCLAGRAGVVRGRQPAAGQRPAERPHPALDGGRRRVGVPPAVAVRQRPHARPAGPADRLLAPGPLRHAHRARTARRRSWPTAIAASG